MSLLVVIPAHNEAASLRGVVDDLRRHGPPCAILVVDDASDDATADLLPGLGVAWLRLPHRLGVGGAVRAGLRYAQRMGYERVVRCDGDGQHPAAAIPRLLAPLAAGGAEAVLGSRYLAGEAEISRAEDGYRTPGARRLGQRALAGLLSAATGRPVSDPTSGFWAFGPRAVALLARHHPTGYPEPELLLFLHRNRLPVIEVGVEMRPRLAGRSSLTPLRELQALARVALALVIVPLRAPEGKP